MVGALTTLPGQGRIDVMRGPLENSAEGVLVRIWVVPGSSRDEIVGVYGDRIKVRTTAAPEGGKANLAVQRVLEQVLGHPVRLIAGVRSRAKVFEVDGMTIEQVRGNLGG